MSLEELHTSLENLSALKALLWLFYPMAVLIAREFLAHTIDDDDDQDRSKMIPILQSVQ